MKVLTILGARPQFIKAGTVSREFKKQGITEVIIHTGQHFDHNMSQVFFDEMEIPQPNYNLGINSLTHGAMTGRMLEEIEKVLLTEKPQLVLVYGDTNSTLAGALAAQKLSIPVAHIEAGLRSFNMAMPEEVNRILTDRISKFLFCPTTTAVSNLKKEGFDHFNCLIENTGDVMFDAALFYGQKSAEKAKVYSGLQLSGNFVLATVHRQENTDTRESLTGIIDALNTINNSMQVVVPMHPRTQKIVGELNLETRFTIIPPVGYFDMVELLKNCSVVLTDSGGLQKEAFFFKKGCVTLRNETEWTELVDNGFNTLVGANNESIIKGWETMMGKTHNFSINLYGDGRASERIVSVISRIQ